MRFSVGDSSELEQAMKRLIGDPNLRERMGEIAKADSAQFAVDSVMAQWRKAIEG